MRARIIVIALLTALIPASTLHAAPVSPEITVQVAPTLVRPAQAGYVYVGGHPSYQVQATMDGQPMNVFWSGHGHTAYFAFDFDEPPGMHEVVVTVTDPLTQTSTTFTETVQVSEYSYPLEYIALPFALLPLLDEELNERENERLAEILSGFTTPDTFDWPFNSPVPFGIVTSRFGGNRSYNAGIWRQYHTGADFRRTVGDPIYAPADGRIAAIEALQVYGNVVIIDHGYGVFSLFAHTSDSYTEVGQWVQRGQLVAAAGASGRTNGPHLHWEVIVNGIKVDPLAWLALDPTYIPLREVTAEDG